MVALSVLEIILLSLIWEQRYFNMIRSLFIFLILSISVCSAQIKTIKDIPFNVGEKLSFKAYYNWGFIWVNAGKVNFSVHRNSDSTMLLKSEARSLTSYDWLFKVRDTFKVTVTADSLKPLEFYRNTYEGGYWVKNQFEFDYANYLIRCQLNNSKISSNTKSIGYKKGVRDVLSSVYFARTIDFSGYNIDDKIRLPMIVDGKIYPLYIRYHGKERVKLPGGRFYDAIKFTAILIPGTIFKGGEDLTVWVTNDNRRVPLMVESKILVGSVKAVINPF